ncbi:MAG: hypothetical protein IPJ67_01410 [Candidatus Moraniibacteriota bacterium]|nr:MAG: hypothetical protein IPJ67_01410 [Candidatus Moranbacteria bacterium]
MTKCIIVVIFPLFVTLSMFIAHPVHADPLFRNQPLENSLPSLLGNVPESSSMPYKEIDFGGLRITAYTNSRPSLSIPVGEATLSVKASRSSVGAFVKIPFE